MADAKYEYALTLIQKFQNTKTSEEVDWLIKRILKVFKSFYPPQKIKELHAQLMEVSSRYKTQAEEIKYCESQPAGVPVSLIHKDIYISYARGYNKPIKKQPRLKLSTQRKRQLREKIKNICLQNPNLYYMSKLTERYECSTVLEKFELLKKSGYLDSEGYWIRNTWYSKKLGCKIAVLENYNTQKCKSKILKAFDDKCSDWKGQIYWDTWNASQAYNVKSEEKALELLKSKVTETQYSRYFCTGFLVEFSKKTGLMYIFRKSRPLLVYRFHPREMVKFEFLASLCIHPQGYYSGTWAGTMTPTDEVVAQLLLMRGDERMLWKKANNHKKGSAVADV